VRVAVVAEWYPSPADPVHGIWAHRQAVAARDAGAEVRVLAMRRPVPPLSVVRESIGSPPTAAPLRAWAKDFVDARRPATVDGLRVEPVEFVAPPRPWSYGTWGNWMGPPLARALDRLRKRWPFDVVHAHNVVPTGFAASRWAGGVGSSPALVVSTHGPDVIHVASRSKIARRATERTLRSADLVMANSRWAQRRCAEIAGGPLPSRVVHFGADVPASTPPRHERPTIVTVAHLQARKRHAVVLHALAALDPGGRPDYVVVGDGPGREPLERMARELGVAESTRFLGQLPHERAVEEAWRCHLFVMPSVEEPFGVAYVEAMAGGVPAIGSRVEGGPEDIAAAGDGLLLVPPDDHLAVARAIERCLEWEEERAALGAAARRTVERAFTWGRCGEATLDAYREAFSSRGAAAVTA
jgi:teichuronic acid biosynthesis glycosyltransferase TuaC